MNRKLITVAVTLPLAFGLSACGGTESKVVEAGESDTQATETVTQVTEAAQQRPSFGQTVEYADGLKLTISEPTEFEPGEFAIGADGEGTALRFTATLDNGTKEDVDPSLISVTVSSAGKEAEQIFDGENDLEGSPSTTLLPGKSTSWDFAFKVADPEDLVMDVSIFDNFDRAKTVYVK